MDQKLNRDLNMYLSVDTYLDSNKVVVNAIPAFSRATVKFHNKIIEIRIADSGREGITAGKTDAKRELRDDLIDACFKVTSVISIYANETGNTEATALFDKTETEINRFKDNELTGFADELYKYSSSILTSLEEYGITSDEITEIDTLSKELTKKIGERGGSEATSIGATQTVRNLMTQTKKMLETELDRFADSLKTKNLDFYNGYYAARRIIDLGVRHEKPAEEKKEEPTA